jgi:hypothetical protein
VTATATKTKQPTLAAILRKHGACYGAKDWAKAGDYGADLERAWNECPRGDYLLWIAAKIGVDRKLVVLAACACARLALRHVKPGEDRPLKAIETAEAWTRGEATIEQVQQAAAYAAAAAAYAAADADAAAYAAAAAAYAAAAAAYAAAAAAYARQRVLTQCASIVRERISFAVVLAAVESEDAE